MQTKDVKSNTFPDLTWGSFALGKSGKVCEQHLRKVQLPEELWPFVWSMSSCWAVVGVPNTCKRITKGLLLATKGSDKEDIPGVKVVTLRSSVDWRFGLRKRSWQLLLTWMERKISKAKNKQVEAARGETGTPSKDLNFEDGLANSKTFWCPSLKSAFFAWQSACRSQDEQMVATAWVHHWIHPGAYGRRKLWNWQATNESLHAVLQMWWRHASVHSHAYTYAGSYARPSPRSSALVTRRTLSKIATFYETLKKAKLYCIQVGEERTFFNIEHWQKMRKKWRGLEYDQVEEEKPLGSAPNIAPT